MFSIILCFHIIVKRTPSWVGNHSPSEYGDGQEGGGEVGDRRCFLNLEYCVLYCTSLYHYCFVNH